MVLTKIKTYTKIKTLLSHLVTKAVDAGPSAQSVWNLLIEKRERKKNLTSRFNIANKAQQ